MRLIKEAIKLPATYSVPAASLKNRDKLIVKSKVFGEVLTLRDQCIVAEHACQLRKLVKDAKSVCAPILKAIKAAADAVRKIQNDYIAPVESEQERCERMLVDYQKREEDRARAEQAARDAELKRLQAPVETGDVAMQELVAYQNEQAAEELMRLPTPEPVKPKGVAIRQRMRYEVTDIHALYAARPDLCRIEENASAIQEYCHPDLPAVPGLRLWFETTAETRAA